MLKSHLFYTFRDLELHRTPASATSATNGYQTVSLANGHEETAENAKMKEMLGALDDLKELLEEPVEEQVRFYFPEKNVVELILGKYLGRKTIVYFLYVLQLI